MAMQHNENHDGWRQSWCMDGTAVEAVSSSALMSTWCMYSDWLMIAITVSSVIVKVLLLFSCCSLCVCRLNWKFYSKSNSGNVTLGRSFASMVLSLKRMSRNSTMILWPRKKMRKCCEWVVRVFLCSARW